MPFAAVFSPMSVVSSIDNGAEFAGAFARISPSSDTDFHFMSCGKLDGTVGSIYQVGINSFNNATGDLDIVAYTLDGRFWGRSQSVSNRETIDVRSAGSAAVVMMVYGYSGATNTYGLHIGCEQ